MTCREKSPDSHRDVYFMRLRFNFAAACAVGVMHAEEEQCCVD